MADDYVSNKLTLWQMCDLVDTLKGEILLAFYCDST